MTELTYTLHDAPPFPNREWTEEEQMPLGKYGALRCQYLKAHRLRWFARLLLSGQLDVSTTRSRSRSSAENGHSAASNNDRSGTDGGIKKRRSTPVGGHNECHYGTDRGDSPHGAGLQLNGSVPIRTTHQALHS